VALSGANNGLAQSYPSKPIRIIVPNAASSGPDITARVIATPLSARLGQQVLVDNRPGAGTMIGGEIAARSPGDGYVLLMGISTLAINPAVYKKVPYDALRDFVPITQAVNLPGILVAHPSVPAKTVKELVALAKARPGDITFSSSGQGGYSHLSMELLLSAAGIRMLHVPYKGSGPALIDLVAGHVSVMISNVLSATPHVRSGKLRGLGVTGSRRSAVAPDVPTIAEAGVPGYEALQWYGLLAPRGTSREIVARLHGETTSVLHTRETTERLEKDGADVVGYSPDEFGAFIRTETVKWAKVAKTAGIRPE
jgi:tripartite-type tricarboxylate transporter receptor subunit TctC